MDQDTTQPVTTHAIVLSPGTELRHQTRTHGEGLKGRTPIRVPGTPHLYQHDWRTDEHTSFAQGIHQYTAHYEEHTGTVSELLSQHISNIGIQRQKIFAPLLLLLESGIQWIKPGQLAVLVTLALNTNAQPAKATIHSKTDGRTEEVILEVGSVLILYGDQIGWELQEGSVSFLHIPILVERVGPSQA